MDMLKIHQEALTETPTAYHEFLLKYRPNDGVVYGLVEGKHDPMYYQSIIEQALPEGWNVELIPTGGRSSTLKAMENFDWNRYPRGRICFFVDRDLSEFIAEITPDADNLYITDKYSIENEAISVGVLKRILSEVFNISELSEQEQSKVKAIFEGNFQVFSESLSVVMAQIIAWRRNNERPNLNNITVEDYFTFEDTELRLKSEFASKDSRLQHSAKCAGVSVASAEDIATAEQEFLAKDGLQKFVRGKYCIWFFLACASNIHRNISGIAARYTQTPKPKIAVGPKNAIVVIAPRLRCPDSLRSFIRGNYEKYLHACRDGTKNNSHIQSQRKSFLSSVFGRLLGA
ncbi:DUF4435 domain-containing protein [Variovorax sp. Varisp41]|uniref:DUF4435 domain-containing protein n=1 Tax=Variovorax sp. Varisp41 TaxID=3243033 RepID=UPI0039B56560